MHFQHLCQIYPPFSPPRWDWGGQMKPRIIPNGKTMNEWSIANISQGVVDTFKRGYRSLLAGRTRVSPRFPSFPPLGPPKWGGQLPKTPHPKNWSSRTRAPGSSWKWFLKEAWGIKSLNPRCYSCFHVKKGPFQSGLKVTFLTRFVQFQAIDRSIYMCSHYNYQRTGYKHLGTNVTWNVAFILEKL